MSSETKETTFEGHTVAVMFCDLIGSTGALRELGTTGFRAFQTQFVKCCCKAKKEATDAVSGKGGLTIDKFMGDGVMLYVDCGSPNDRIAPETVVAATARLMEFVTRLSAGLLEILEAQTEVYQNSKRRQLGLRFGIALGNDVARSTLGDPPDQSTTLTGAVVNLAARLEHATVEEFLSDIAKARNRTEAYLGAIKDPTTIHGTSLGDRIALADRQVIDLAEVCEKRFQVRTTRKFIDALEKAPDSKGRRLRWREIPFAPRGFDETGVAELLGGDTLPDLLREA